MTVVTFTDSDRFDLAAAFAVPLGASADPTARTIQIDGPLAPLIERASRAEPTALPRRLPGGDVWVVTAAVRRDLEAALASAAHFVVPTYAEHADGLPTHRDFVPADEAIGAAGAAVYPAGYYELRSPQVHFGRVLERLGRWATLERRRPPPRSSRTPAYRDLHDAFVAALAAGSWDVAAAQLDEIRRRGLATAENQAFLSIQLLAQQGRWGELWGRDDYSDLARLRVPREVRRALLAAFHQSVLLPLEQAGRWEEALNEFRQARGRAGSLLEGLADVGYVPALRAFAYREAAAGDWAALEGLAERAPDDETRRAVELLAALLPTPAQSTEASPAAPALNPQQRLRAALTDGDYTAAWSVAEALTDGPGRAGAKLEIAFFDNDVAHAEEALLELWALDSSDQETLLTSHKLRQISAALAAAASPAPPSAAEETPIADWVAWLACAADSPDDPRLPRVLHVVAAADDRYWTQERVARLAELLTELAAGNAASGRSHIREAVRHLRAYFLRDPDFPRDDATHADVYEALYSATLDHDEANEATILALLRLAEARLRRRPAARDAVAGHLQNWLADPVPALGSAALETIDVLAAYGVQGPALGQWFRRWAQTLLDAPRPPDRLSLESWAQLAEWIQPGADVIAAFQSRLASIGRRESDPVAALPPGCRIAVFILSPERAARAGELLCRRNPSIDFQICDDMFLTDRAKNLAQTADIAVVVTGCVKHALTYGIGPYLRDPVYPDSVGSTSILRAIEDRAASIRSRQASTR